MMINIWGLLSWIAGLIILLTSFEFVRRRWYSIFHMAHFIFLAFYIFGALHNDEMLTYTIAVAVLYLLDRLIRVMWGFWPQKTVHLRYKEGDIIQVVFKKHFMARLLNLHRVGQYMFLNFPTISVTEWHPFSISSGPEEQIVEVHIKALGDHTRQLVDSAKERGSLWVRCDGPYGNHRINFRRFHVLVLVAGGIGVTPVMGFVKDVYRFGQIDPKAKRPASVLQRVIMVWTVQNYEQYMWFGEELKTCLQNSRSLPDMPSFDLRVHITKDAGGHNEPFFYSGRPAMDDVFDEIVANYKGKASTVFTCGPRQMVNDCWDATNDRKRSGHAFHFHHETFEF